MGSAASDPLVSPQHRNLVRSQIARKMFGMDEVLSLYPPLRDHDHAPEPARLPASGRMARNPARRLAQVVRPLLMA